MANRNNLLLGTLLLLQLGLVGWQHRPLPEAKTSAHARVFDDITAEDVVELKLEDGDKTLDLSREGDGWVVASAFGHPADDEKVDRVLRELTALEVADVVSTSGKFQHKLKVAEDTFVRRATLSTKAGSQSILMGTPGRAGSTHLRRGDSDDIVAVRDFGTWKLSTSPSSWLDTTLFEADKSRIVELTIEHGEEEILLRRTEAGWRLGASAAAEEEVDKLLAKIERLTLSDVVGEVDSAADAALVVTVGLAALSADAKGATESPEQPPESDEGAVKSTDPLAVKERTTLHFAPDEGSENRYLAWREGEPHVVKVSKWAIEPLLDVTAGSLLTD